MLDTMMNKNDREEFHCVISDIILLPLITRWGALSGWNEQLWVTYSNFKVVITETKFYESLEHGKILLKFVKYSYSRRFLKEVLCSIKKFNQLNYFLLLKQTKNTY